MKNYRQMWSDIIRLFDILVPSLPNASKTTPDFCYQMIFTIIRTVAPAIQQRNAYDIGKFGKCNE